ncbi:MAG TPA: hypothetical protein VKD71_08865 [Gemmataceae bacterium]|nr:hypothetical protein [Gemmataceae bacterium]
MDLEVDCDWLKSSHVSEYCAFDGKSTTLYLASDGLLYAHKLPLKSPPRTLPLVGERKPKGVAYSLSLLQEGKVLQVISNCDYGSRLQLERFDAADPAAGTKVFSERLKPDCTPAVSPDGSLMAIGTSTERKDFGRDYSLEIWSVVPSKRLAHYDKLGGDLTVMRFTPDGKVLATGGSDGTLALYDVGTGKLTRTLTENYTVSSVDFHPSRPYLAYTTYDRHGTPNLGIVDLPSGLEIGKSSVDVYGARQVCFSPDGKTVVTVGGEAQVRVWEFGSLIEK